MTINPTFSVCVCVLVIKKLREKMKKRVGNVIERPRQAVMKAVNVQVFELGMWQAWSGK